jgi:type II secretory pathway pseudopilin PulG
MEVLLAAAVLVIVASIGAFSYVGYQRSVELDAAARLLVATLRDAQGRSMAGQDDRPWGVHLDVHPTNRYVLYRDDGSGYAGSTVREETYLSSYVKIASVTVSGGGSDVVFLKRTGRAATYGTGPGSEAVRVEDAADSSRFQKITVTAQGRVDVE